MGRTVKVLLVGASGTGKTSLRGQYVSGTFSEGYRATIGTDFIAKTLAIGPSGSRTNGEWVTLQIWDTAGQERFSSLSSAFFRGADAVILVYDASRPEETLEEMKKWWHVFVEKCPIPEGEEGTWPVAVVGNKLDLVEGEVVGNVSEILRTLIPIRGSPAEDSPESWRTIGNGNGIGHPTEPHPDDATVGRGTSSSVISGFTIYHTPSSSLHEGTVTSEISSNRQSMYTATEHSRSPEQSERSLSRSRSRRDTVTSMSASSGSPTITPSMFTRRAREGETTPTRSMPQPPEEGARLFLASAKTGEGVPQIFSYIAERTVARMEWLESIEARTFHIRETTVLPASERTNNNSHSGVRLGLGGNLDLHSRCCT